MVTSTGTSMRAQSRARSLLLVWKRDLEQKLQINDCLLGCWRGNIKHSNRKETRGQTADLRQTRDQKPSHVVHPDLMATDGSLFGRAIPKAAHDLVKCLGRGIHLTLPSSPRSVS